MSVDRYEQLNELHFDILREIGNIGAGNSATALSQMIGMRVDMTLPSVKIVDINQAAMMLGGPENVVIGILSKLGGEIRGTMMFIIELDFAKYLLKFFMGQEVDECTHLTDIQLSAISEIGNIMIASYINSISTLSNLNVSTSVPAIAIDMVGSLLNFPAATTGEITDEMIFIEGGFSTDDNEMTSKILLLPVIGSLNKILNMTEMEI